MIAAVHGIETSLRMRACVLECVEFAIVAVHDEYPDREILAFKPQGTVALLQFGCPAQINNQVAVILTVC